MLAFKRSQTKWHLEAGPCCKCVQVLTAIELARNARIAANKAFLSSLSGAGMDTAEGWKGTQQNPLPVDHPLVLAAARKLAQKASLEEARQQVYPNV